jgi:hypothetical protein
LSSKFDLATAVPIQAALDSKVQYSGPCTALPHQHHSLLPPRLTEPTPHTICTAPMPRFVVPCAARHGLHHTCTDYRLLSEAVLSHYSRTVHTEYSTLSPLHCVRLPVLLRLPLRRLALLLPRQLDALTVPQERSL